MRQTPDISIACPEPSLSCTALTASGTSFAFWISATIARPISGARPANVHVTILARWIGLLVRCVYGEVGEMVSLFFELLDETLVQFEYAIGKRRRN